MSVVPAWPGADTAEEIADLSPWDTVVIAGGVLPGRCRVSGKHGRKMDVKQSPGKNGATLSNLGYQPATFEVEVLVWTQAQLDVLEIVVGLLKPRPSQGSPKAVSVSHPALGLVGIRQAFLVEMDLLTPASTHGVFAQKFRFIEKGPLSDTGNGVKPSATTIAAKTAFDVKTAFDIPGLPNVIRDLAADVVASTQGVARQFELSTMTEAGRLAHDKQQTSNVQAVKDAFGKIFSDADDPKK